MTFGQFLEGIVTFAKENPETLNMTVVFSEDDEGNGYSPVHYGPTKGFFEDGEFRTEGNEDEDEDETTMVVNAVCIN